MRIDAGPVLMRGAGGRGESPSGKISESRLMSEAAVDADSTDMPRLRVVECSSDQLSMLASSLASSARDMMACGPE